MFWFKNEHMVQERAPLGSDTNMSIMKATNYPLNHCILTFKIVEMIVVKPSLILKVQRRTCSCNNEHGHYESHKMSKVPV